MSYEERLKLATENVIQDCKRILAREYESPWFETWLTADGDMEFGDCYQKKFKEQFANYMNADVEYRLYFAGKNLVYCISSFLSYKKNATLSSILKFAESFMEEQLEDFGNWCDEISLAMGDESGNDPEGDPAA